MLTTVGRTAAVTVDCTDALVVGRFWAAALGRPLDPQSSSDFASIGMPQHRDRRGWRVEGDPTWLFAKVPEGKAAKNRMHVDMAAADQEAAVARLAELGATRVADKVGLRMDGHARPRRQRVLRRADPLSARSHRQLGRVGPVRLPPGPILPRSPVLVGHQRMETGLSMPGIRGRRGSCLRYARRASSSRTGPANPSRRRSPNSRKRKPLVGADAATLALTNTWPAPACAAIRAARLTVRPK
jgi:hypothetical protein